MENQAILESLSPIERKVLPFIKLGIKEIEKKSGLDETSVMRALQFLENKRLVKLTTREEKIVDLGDNGVLYLKNELPERKLLNLLADKKEIKLDSRELKLSDNEFKAALGALKKKAMIELKQGKITLTASMAEVSRKMLEEQLLEALPCKYEELKPEQLHALNSLKERKDIVRVEEKKQIDVEATDLGESLMNSDLKHAENLLEALTPDLLAADSWKGKKFRRYDIKSTVPEISGGKRHFTNQAIDYARKIWTEMGFKEMSGNYCQTSFWNFDALFTAQDHPVREMQDTFFLDKLGKLPDNKIVSAVKKAHESGVSSSKGWGYKWNENEARKVVLRTHTTVLSARTLAQLNSQKSKEGKYFAVGKCFRNEAVDYGHLFAFNQTEGIVIGKDLNLRHLLGYLKQFAEKMGYSKVRFRPSYFPYTEPSLEGDVWDEERKEWREVIAAGIFRPEVVVPLLGENLTVLAWGPGFDRLITKFFNIKDIRDLYRNNIEQLRKIKFWGQNGN